MRIVYLTPPRRQPPSLLIDIRGKQYDFRPLVKAAKVHYVAPVDPADEETIREFVAAADGRYALDESPAARLTVETPRLPDPAPLTPGKNIAVDDRGFPPPVAQAFRNGWVMADLTGAGERDDWGPTGGFGLRSGLTMAQLALTVPPQNWETASAEAWPWEVPGWIPPLGFTPPAVPSRRKPPELAPLSSAVVGSEEGPGEAPRDARSSSDALRFFEGAPEPFQEPGEAPEEEIEEDPAGGSDPAWTEERIASARAVIAKITEESGKSPNPSKAKYHLKRAGFPPINNATLGRLLNS